MSRTIRKATEAERAAYKATGAVYPLYGYIAVKADDGTTHDCAVEDLRGSWSKPDPVYELLAPDGYRWGAGMCTRSQLAHNLRGVVEDAQAGLEKGEPL